MFIFPRFPSSNFPKVIMLQFFSREDVVYIMYKTTDRVVSASEYGRDVYANALENV